MEANTPQRGPDSNVAEAFLSPMSQTRGKRHETRKWGIPIAVAERPLRQFRITERHALVPHWSEDAETSWWTREEKLESNFRFRKSV
jgi:hypothetical protein